jgi:RluA family pseudouridine synthase
MEPEPAVLFYDDALLVINKPAGLLSIPDGYDPNKPHLRELLEAEYGPLWIVHRLDKDTSGVIILARNKEAHRELNTQFSEHRVRKIYHAPIRTNVGRRKRSIVDTQRGKPASTTFSVITPLRGHTLLQAQPATGRTHQIRVHLYSMGYPVLADPLYGTGKPSAYLQRLALHAQSLTLQHPGTGASITYAAPYPEDFEAALDALWL